MSSTDQTLDQDRTGSPEAPETEIEAGLGDEVELLSEPKRIPESWASRSLEVPSAGQARYLAVEAAECHKTLSGFSSEYDQISEKPRTVPGLAVLYVRRDARYAFVRSYRTIDGRGGEVPDPDTFRSGLAKPPNYGDDVGDDNRRLYAKYLRELYGIELDDVDVLEEVTA